MRQPARGRASPDVEAPGGLPAGGPEGLPGARALRRRGRSADAQRRPERAAERPLRGQRCSERRRARLPRPRCPRAPPRWCGPAFAASCCVLLLLLLRCLRVVQPGEVGVVSVLGRLRQQPLYPGVSVICPLAAVTRVGTRTRTLRFRLAALAAEGVRVRLEVMLLLHIDPDNAPTLFAEVGSEWRTALVEPYFTSIVSEVVAAHSVGDLYHSRPRAEMGEAIAQRSVEILSPHGVVVEAASVTSLSLPALLSAAIDEKMVQEQEMEAMQWVLARERAEARRLAIEAEGLAFKARAASATTDDMLTWLEVDAAGEVAASCGASALALSGPAGAPVISPT
eukprot:TRINITY_DN32086_c0_g1_i1.p2 TRINITY_DN32086_c0_g1~~TRINITY_DN32086_c0_g1_i1.p2  ORF type:complete len:339 (+),score=104.82 TRINITY_DN32086_c0_g1_i1:78-1094(+)